MVDPRARVDPHPTGVSRAVALDPPADDPFGPRAAYSSGARLDTGALPDRLVDTHCCFCGQQCGIRLKVKDEDVIGFEPHYDSPFNRGMLCPKGIKRYLQGSHPDRLLTAFERDSGAPGGFRPIAYASAIERAAASIQRVQEFGGRDAMAVLSGASLTTEKVYLIGKFAHAALRTSNIDYNGRLCMVSAGAGNNKAFGVDRAANPWSDILGAEVIWISGANIAECAPITTEYVWQARDRGARVIVVDPRLVATQSVAVLAVALETPFGWRAETVTFVALVFFLVGCMLYLAIITLIFYRVTFLPLETAALTPPYWISMGALAITTLAGSGFLLAGERSPLIADIAPFLRGFTLFFWSAGSWWIPLLLVLGAWRHLWRRHPIAYDPQYWGMVFPLGMYAAATWRLADALPFAPLQGLARGALAIALLAWVATALGMAIAGARALRA